MVKGNQVAGTHTLSIEEKEKEEEDEEDPYVNVRPVRCSKAGRPCARIDNSLGDRWIFERSLWSGGCTGTLSKLLHL